MLLFPKRVQLIVPAFALQVACGGTVIEGSGGVGGMGVGGASSSSSTSASTSTGSITGTTLPSDCSVATTDPPPYPVTFQFVVGSNQSAFLSQSCYTQFTVTSCADGYQAPIALRGDCTVECSNTTDCIACEPCPVAAVHVVQGAAHKDGWDGQIYSFSTTPSGCSCHTSVAAPAGKYRIHVPIYQTEEQALTQQDAIVVPYDFELPAPDGVVIVNVGLQPI